GFADLTRPRANLLQSTASLAHGEFRPVSVRSHAVARPASVLYGAEREWVRRSREWPLVSETFPANRVLSPGGAFRRYQTITRGPRLHRRGGVRSAGTPSRLVRPLLS